MATEAHPDAVFHDMATLPSGSVELPAVMSGIFSVLALSYFSHLLPCLCLLSPILVALCVFLAPGA